jgi:hypothetical protein
MSPTVRSVSLLCNVKMSQMTEVTPLSLSPFLSVSFFFSMRLLTRSNTNNVNTAAV